MKYVIYRRVSTEKQKHHKTKSTDGLGLQAQSHACREWITRNGGGSIKEYTDIITGTDKKDLEDRPQLMKALESLKPGDVFLVAKLDRLSRDPYLNAVIEKTLIKKKATLVCADGDYGGNEPHQEFMRVILAGAARYEAKLISKRISMALQRKIANGERVGHIPYGKRLGDHGKLEIVLDEQIVINEIKKAFDSGKTCRQVAQLLNDNGYRNRNGALWNHGSVNRIHKNNLVIA